MIAVGLVALGAVLPQSDDVFDAVAVTVKREHERRGLITLLRNQQVKRQLGMPGCANDELLAHERAAVALFDHARFGIDLGLIEKAEAFAQRPAGALLPRLRLAHRARAERRARVRIEQRKRIEIRIARHVRVSFPETANDVTGGY